MSGYASPQQPRNLLTSSRLDRPRSAAQLAPGMDGRSAGSARQMLGKTNRRPVWRSGQVAVGMIAVDCKSMNRRMAIIHQRRGAHGRVRVRRPRADVRFPRRRRRLRPLRDGHCVENTGSASLRFLELFKSSYCADVSLNQWLARTPPDLVKVHLDLNQEFMDALRKTKSPIMPVWVPVPTKSERRCDASRLTKYSHGYSAPRCLHRPDLSR
jgi:hypothetical protein